MFFQNKKKSYWRRLWKVRVNPTTSAQEKQQHDTMQQKHSQQQQPTSTIQSLLGKFCANSNSDSTLDLLDCDMMTLFRAFMKALKKVQYETLCQAVEGLSADAIGTGKSHHHSTTECVLVPRQKIHGEEPQVIACRLWRWWDLHESKELRRIPKCPNENSAINVCCNPVHWSRLCQQDTPGTPPPPPPYHLAMNIDADNSTDQDVYGGYSKQQIGSLTTEGDDLSTPGWCELAYWELRERVGHKIPVEAHSFDVFTSEEAKSSGLCLKTLALQRSSLTPEQVLKTREKIGLGVTLSREPDGVWLYNRSTSPVFVHSPTLYKSDSRTTVVHKVPPGHCLRAFDPLKVNESTKWPSLSGVQLGPVDPHSVQISFVKGWGLKYSRQDVTACPCRLEVLLNRHFSCR